MDRKDLNKLIIKTRDHRGLPQFYGIRDRSSLTPEQNQEIEQNVQLMIKRYELGLDLWNGEKLSGFEADYEQRMRELGDQPRNKKYEHYLPKCVTLELSPAKRRVIYQREFKRWDKNRRKFRRLIRLYFKSPKVHLSKPGWVFVLKNNDDFKPITMLEAELFLRHLESIQT